MLRSGLLGFAMVFWIQKLTKVRKEFKDESMQYQRDLKRFFFTVVVAAFASTFFFTAFAAPKTAKPAIKASAQPAAMTDPVTILEKTEFIRNPPDDYSVHVDLSDDKNGKIDLRAYETLLKGRDKALVKFLTPATEVGTRVLMVAQDMWVFIPSSAKPVRISAQQKLTGNAAYGDIARLSFVGNYTPKLLRQDKLDGKEAYVLELTSIEGRPVTYDRLEHWVAVENFHPLKTLYKTSSGKQIRESSYSDYEQVFGTERPTKIVLINSLQSANVTTLKFKDAKKQDLPDLLFEKQNLSRN